VKPILLDGGMGTELRYRGIEVPSHTSSIWSALALMQAPDAVREVHEAYIEAGADVITVNNYAVVPKLLEKEGLEHRLAELTETACDLASQARDQGGNGGRWVRIAGSLPPLDISYRDDLVGADDAILATYREIAALLAPRVDILLCETMSKAQEARMAATAALETGKPVWVSWTLQGSALAILPSGESVSDAMRAIADLPVEAALVNCCPTEAVSASLPLLREAKDRLIGGYANRVRRPGRDEANILDFDGYAEAAAHWIELGANIVGGCCSTRPADIARIRERIERMQA
jgi:S-methylmethionine-dependent homocysteine/selenocysteine methylase